MQLLEVQTGFQASPAVRQDIARIEEIWQSARELVYGKQEWILGDYSLADVFYTPVAARILGYDLEVSAEARAYCLRLLSTPAVKQWRAKGLEVTYDPFPYPTYPPQKPWPVE